MNRFIFWQRWLLTVSILIVIFGLVLAVASGTSLIDPLNRMVDPVFWGSQTVPPQAAAFRGWTYAVMGAVMAGWGVFLASVAGIPFRRRERWARNCMVLGILFWYVLDTGFSLQAGVMFNAAVNTVLLAFIAFPLIFTRREFASDPERNRG
jgi:hypothetical protein